MKKIFILIFLFFGFLCIGGCKPETLNNNKKTKVFVSILPQKYFVERVGGENIEIEVMVKPGSSPATYEPTLKQIIALKKTDIFFRIGVPFENSWIEKIQEINPNMKIIDTRENIILREIDKFEKEDKDKEKDFNHSHFEVKDPHIWLSPRLVITQTKTIEKALSKIKPEKKEFFQRNSKKFQEELLQLEIEIKNYFQKIKSKEFLVFHPSWGYFADNFGLKQYSIEIEGKEPSVNELLKIIEQVKAKKIKTIFVQKQFSKAKAKSIAEQIGGIVIEIDPLAENYLENLKNIAQTFSQYLQIQEDLKIK